VNTDFQNAAQVGEQLGKASSKVGEATSDINLPGSGKATLNPKEGVEQVLSLAHCHQVSLLTLAGYAWSYLT
jgi:hypothetical protein